MAKESTENTGTKPNPVTYLVFGVVAVLWGIIAPFVWIPMLFRVTAVYSAIVFYMTITRQKQAGLIAYLDRATGFYMYGFRTAYKIVFSDDDPDEAAGPIKLPMSVIAKELGSAFLTWIVILAVLSPDFLAGLFVSFMGAVKSVLDAPVPSLEKNTWGFWVVCSIVGIAVFIITNMASYFHGSEEGARKERAAQLKKSRTGHVSN